METSNLKETLEAIDTVINKKKAVYSRGQDLQELMKDQRFINVVLDGYFKSEAAKLFTILTDPNDDSLSNEEVLQRLEGINQFKRYVGTMGNPGTLMIEAMIAPDEIIREEQYRLEVTAMDGDN